MSLDDILHKHAERQPARPAILTPSRAITYGDLNASVSRLARRLLDSGLLPGDRVAIHWSNSIERASSDARDNALIAYLQQIAD